MEFHCDAMEKSLISGSFCLAQYTFEISFQLLAGPGPDALAVYL
jgi:hypothetical protein